MSDNELFAVLLGALALALLLRRFTRTHASGTKIGLAVSLISTLRALAIGMNSKVESAPVATDLHNAAPPKAEKDDSRDLDYLEFLWMQNAQRGQPNTWEPIEHSNRDLMDDFHSGPKENY